MQAWHENLLLKINFRLVVGQRKGSSEPLEAPPPSYGPDLIENNLIVLLCGQRRCLCRDVGVVRSALHWTDRSMVRVKLDLSFRVRSLYRKCGVGREFYPVKQLSTDSTRLSFKK